VSAALLYAAAACVVVTCLVHSLIGEMRLIGPIMAIRTGVLQNDLARKVLRFAWHFMSALGLISAYVLIAAARNPLHADHILLLLIGIIFTGAGFFDAIYTRGKHIGWPLLVAAGLTTLSALI
jgi:uncharacterized membrane protein HdeD (DUF308 family)